MHKHECIKVTKKSLKLQSENKKTCFTLDNPHYALPLREIKTYNQMIQKTYKAYLFDFDYTLADSSRGIVMCFRNVLANART